MVELVGEHRVVAAQQRADHADVGHVAGGEQECCGLPDEARQAAFQFVMRRAMAAHQMRSTGTDAVARGALLRGRDQVRVIRQAEIIVAAEGKVLLAIDRDVRALGAFQYAAGAQQALLLQGFEV